MSIFKAHIRRYGFTTLGLFLLTVGILYGPIQQPVHYHDFADQHRYLGIPNTLDVLSNLGFLIAGLWGVYCYPANRPASPAWLLCFWSLIATALGSAYYHLNPDNTRLVWDRLPITLTCTSLLIATAPTHRDTWLNLLVGSMYAIFSVIWWQQTGDLMFYLAVQLQTLIWVPLSLFLQRRQHAAIWALLATLAYLIAKGCEWQDHQLYQWLSISGHTLKHLISGLAAIGLVQICRYHRKACPLHIPLHGSKQIHVS